MRAILHMMDGFFLSGGGHGGFQRFPVHGVALAAPLTFDLHHKHLPSVRIQFTSSLLFPRAQCVEFYHFVPGAMPNLRIDKHF
jgi:hypothetical protein